MEEKEKKNQKVSQIIAMSFFLILMVSFFRGLDEGFDYSE